MFINKEDKKVEYIELIYDLIFVYVIGRNNSLLHHIKDGVVDWGSFYSFTLCTLAIIQVWMFTTFYMNRYGNNRVRDYIFLFINMYLLYYIAEGTRVDWQKDFNQYNIAWGLILFNIGLQYFIEYCNHKDAPWETTQIKRNVFIIWAEAFIVFVSIPIYHTTGIVIAPVAVLFGIVVTTLSGHINNLVVVDFAHLSERAMLYIVFTFGEMIIAVASYFGGGFNFTNIYFSLMGFLIVVGMLLSYGLVYNRILDKNISTNGTGFMMMHVFMIFALSCVTVGLEFMREPEVNVLFKITFLVASILLYYLFLFLTERYAKERLKPSKKFLAIIFITTIVFIVLMIVLRNQMYINIALTVVFIFSIFGWIHRFSREIKEIYE